MFQDEHDWLGGEMIWGWYSSEGTYLGYVTVLKTHFFIQLEQVLKLPKLGLGLQRKIKAAFSWNAGNHKTGPGLQTVRQDRLGRELMSPLITCISLAPAKGARLVAPGAALSIYPQSRYSGMAGYHRDAKACYNSSHPGSWREVGDEASVLWLPTRGPVPCTTSQKDGIPNCRAVWEREIKDHRPASILRDGDTEGPGILFFALHSRCLKMNEYLRERRGQRESKYWVQMRFIRGLSHSRQLATHQAVWFIVPTG